MLLVLVAGAPLMANDVVTTGDDLGADVSSVDGRIAMDLAGDIWTLPASGGQAELLIDESFVLRRPRWAPDGTALLYQSATSDGNRIWIADVDSPSPRRVNDGDVHEQDAAWHPDGDRIVFSTDRDGNGLDIWEVDVPTGLRWRLTDHPADEFEPVWSSNGLHLAWLRRSDERWQLMLRRRGQAEAVVVESAERLSSPAWRPDGSLLTYLRHTEAGPVLEMAILSEPVLIRALQANENFVSAPVSWRDRYTLVYTADGLIRTRGFEDRVSRPLHFRAFLKPVEALPEAVVERRTLEVINPPDGRTVIRGARLFDGLWPGYRRNMDIVLEDGRIVAVEARVDHEDSTIIDLGDVTILPGLVDAWSAGGSVPQDGPAILAYGVTTIVTDEDAPAAATDWHGEAMPGPRVIVIDDAGRLSGALSIADSGIEALESLLNVRQASALGHTRMPPRRFAALPDLGATAPSIVAGSKPNRMAPGLGLHAEMRALVEAGLSAEQALHAVGRNPARSLGLEFQAGTIVPGAVADLLLISGDPLADVDDTLNIVAVVRNGRFFSVVSLLERATSTASVE